MTFSAEQVIAVIVALVSGILAMYRSFCKRAEKSENFAVDHWQKCEEEHRATRQDLTDMQVKMGYLEGRQDGITSLSHQVLDEITKLKNDSSETS